MELSFAVTDMESVLKTISSIAVIVGTVLVVLQLRLNARQARARTAFDLVGSVIAPTFPARRHRLYEVSRKHAGGDWTGFYQSLDDFEVRNFASIYEQLGLLVRRGVVSLDDVMECLSAQPLADWTTFEPIRKHIMESSAVAFPALANDLAALEDVYWPNFRWLAEQNRTWVQRRVSAGQAPKAAGGTV